VIGQSSFSVVRLVAIGLFSLGLIACTAQHTREIGRKTLQDIGLKRSVKISRTGYWSLPMDTAVYLAPVYIVGDDQESYPRLRNQLDRLLATLVAEGLQERSLPENSTGAGVLLRVGLVGAVDNLSSVSEMDRHGISAGDSGRDRLRLVMHVYDARTGKHLDTLSGQAISGWSWKEHQVTELAEPTLRAMLTQLRGAQITAAAE
jgi:hypothetical protein